METDMSMERLMSLTRSGNNASDLERRGTDVVKEMLRIKILPYY